MYLFPRGLIDWESGSCVVYGGRLRSRVEFWAIILEYSVWVSHPYPEQNRKQSSHVLLLLLRWYIALLSIVVCIAPLSDLKTLSLNLVF